MSDANQSSQLTSESVGAAPADMPPHLSSTYHAMRDILYLAAHDSAFNGIPVPQLTEALTTHVGLRQAFLYREGEWPMFFAIWARMNDDSIRKMMDGGYTALQPEDLHSGDRTVLTGISAPWRQEDFDRALVWSAMNLGRMSDDGHWYMVLPAEGGIPVRLTRYVAEDVSGGRFEEARL